MISLNNLNEGQYMSGSKAMLVNWRGPTVVLNNFSKIKCKAN